jgi:pyridoxal phosphate enzyme (YggS family)
MNNLTPAKLRTNITALQRRIEIACEKSHRSPDEVKLVAVTKTMPAAIIRDILDCGIRDFAENRVQEAQQKMEDLADLKPFIIWHMVGHVQSNKARLAVTLFDIIHSVDSVKLARLLSRQTTKTLDLLLEVNVAEEETKSGFETGEIARAVKEISRLTDLNIKGLMTVAPLVDDPEDSRPFFRQLRNIRDILGLEHLSMGMSDDFEIAIEEGATIIRIGRALFGERRRQCV